MSWTDVGIFGENLLISIFQMKMEIVLILHRTTATRRVAECVCGLRCCPPLCLSVGWGSLKGHGSYNMFNPQWKPMLHRQLQEVQWSPAGQRSDSSSRQAWLARCISYFHTVTIWMPILTNKRHFFYLLEKLKERYFKSGFTRISETLSYFNNIE